MSLPKQVAGVYWINWGKNTPLDQIPAAYNVIYAAFAYGDGSGTGRAVFKSDDGSGVSSATFAGQVKNAQAQGRKVLLSIGGANPVGLKLLSSTNVTELTNSINGIVDAYNFDGIDWDLEQASIYTVANLLSCTSNWKTRYGSGFVIACAPAPSSTPYKQFAQQAQAAGMLDMIACQYYDYSDSNRYAGIKSRTDELVNTYKVAPSRIGIGCKVGSDSMTEPAGFWRDAIQQLRGAYPDAIGGMTWEATAEKVAGNPFATTAAPAFLAGLPTDPVPPPPDPTPLPPDGTEVTVSVPVIAAGSGKTKWVRTAQGLLVARGFSVKINGTFSSGMTTSVKNFQSSVAIPANGIIGPETWTRLITG